MFVINIEHWLNMKLIIESVKLMSLVLLFTTWFFYLLLVGSDGDVARLTLDINAMRFKQHQPSFPRSFCSEPCKHGQAKLQLEGDTCCWLCTNCSQYQYLPDEYHCDDCPEGKLQCKNFNTNTEYVYNYLKMTLIIIFIEMS